MDLPAARNTLDPDDHFQAFFQNLANLGAEYERLHAKHLDLKAVIEQSGRSRESLSSTADSSEEVLQSQREPEHSTADPRCLESVRRSLSDSVELSPVGKRFRSEAMLGMAPEQNSSGRITSPPISPPPGFARQHSGSLNVNPDMNQNNAKQPDLLASLQKGKTRRSRLFTDAEYVKASLTEMIQEQEAKDAYDVRSFYKESG
eukprot:gb/GFBE01079177.1/.p1 GENE.gb/GFBE01079177.1/~~gb/GFBE01079177.1/.p1  ORF type:complete len:203 (+),score=37.54 gb/GFBE01079177.1/:1-609(+)